MPELRGPVRPDRVPALAAGLAGAAVVRVRGRVDLGVLDVLARLALAARGGRGRLQVLGDSQLCRLVRLIGLMDALAVELDALDEPAD